MYYCFVLKGTVEFTFLTAKKYTATFIIYIKI